MYALNLKQIKDIAKDYDDIQVIEYQNGSFCFVVTEATSNYLPLPSGRLQEIKDLLDLEGFAVVYVEGEDVIIGHLTEYTSYLIDWYTADDWAELTISIQSGYGLPWLYARECEGGHWKVFKYRLHDNIKI